MCYCIIKRMFNNSAPHRLQHRCRYLLCLLLRLFPSSFLLPPSSFLPLFCIPCIFFQSGTPPLGVPDTLYGLITVIFEIYRFNNIYFDVNMGLNEYLLTQHRTGSSTGADVNSDSSDSDSFSNSFLL